MYGASVFCGEAFVPSKYIKYHRVHLGVEWKQGECICPLNWSVHHSFVSDGRYSIVEGGGRASPPTTGWANFSIMMECTPERGTCYSV
jgi:hypothetical protein